MRALDINHRGFQDQIQKFVRIVDTNQSKNPLTRIIRDNRYKNSNKNTNGKGTKEPY